MQTEWSPAFTIRAIVLSVCSLLANPNLLVYPNFDYVTNQPVEHELAALFREEGGPAKYEQEARAFTREHAWPGKY